MRKVFKERNIAAALFVLVLIIFSIADRDTKKLQQQYGKENNTESNRMMAQEEDTAHILYKKD